jgi:cytochrome b561
MDVFNSIGMKLIVSLGILAGITALLIYLSCRVFPAWKPAKKITNNATYRKFFKMHGKLWWLFWGLVILHFLAVLFYFYIPL